MKRYEANKSGTTIRNNFSNSGISCVGIKLVLQNPSGLAGVLGVTAPKHVVLGHDIETGSVWPLIQDQCLLRLHVLENLIRSNHAQSGAVQVNVFEAYNYEYHQSRITII